MHRWEKCVPLQGGICTEELTHNFLHLCLCSFWVVIKMLWLPLIFLSLKCFHHWNTVTWLIASVPYTVYNTFNISSLLFVSFTQNSVTQLCLKAYDYPSPSPLWNRFLARARTNTCCGKWCFALIANHAWGSNIAHAPSQSRPLKMSTVPSLKLQTFLMK
jgi:hypothetical protein